MKKAAWLRLSVLTISACAVAAFLFMAYSAGCAGDTKGGALGDPVRALEIDGQSLLPMMIALVALASMPFTIQGLGAPVKAVASTVLFLCACALLLAAGVQLEALGVRSCLAR